MLWRCYAAQTTRKHGGSTASRRGHCDQGADALGPVLYSTAENPDALRTLGRYTVSQTQDGTAPTGDNSALPALTDAAVIAFAANTSISSFKIGRSLSRSLGCSRPERDPVRHRGMQVRDEHRGRRHRRCHRPGVEHR